MNHAVHNNLETLGNQLLGCAMKVHSILGPGLLENAYEHCLAREIAKAGLKIDRQVTLPINYEGDILDAGYRLDLLLEDAIVVEVKAVEKLSPLHTAQLLSYLKLGDFRLGFLLNFNVTHLKDGIKRVVNKL
jgi:GxxExxY protein